MEDSKTKGSLCFGVWTAGAFGSGFNSPPWQLQSWTTLGVAMWA